MIGFGVPYLPSAFGVTFFHSHLLGYIECIVHESWDKRPICMWIYISMDTSREFNSQSLCRQLALLTSLGQIGNWVLLVLVVKSLGMVQPEMPKSLRRFWVPGDQWVSLNFGWEKKVLQDHVSDLCTGGKIFSEHWHCLQLSMQILGTNNRSNNNMVDQIWPYYVGPNSGSPT
jgi:hypothetical protein